MTSTLTLAEDRAQRLDAAAQAWNERLSADPANGSLSFTVTGSGTGAVASDIKAGRHTFQVDEPAPLAGDDAAASPVEYALAALASCQIVVYRLYAQQLGIQVDDIKVTANGDLDVHGLFGADPSVRPGFTGVQLDVQLTGPESTERYRELQRVVDEHCPVLDVFKNPVPVSVNVLVSGR
ncbi:OsmC family protein [Glutamicibacter sp. V16R2B1]|uniref:OsmC family protein n=1 Tax=Glutamicibacter sp. V16R2B1 TaxID=2036207 RepID=UPI0010FDD07B|nr:OsmC family protein [Glutamicibacter sp. V16R2B1]TLK52809.1 OsmC family protein [Glutamicibacter sp. V16R2B1]